MGFSERLHEAMLNAGYTQGKLAKAVGMAQSSVNKLLNGASSSRKTVDIAHVLGVRPEWLSSGSGPMKEQETLPHQAESQVSSYAYRVSVLDVSASAGPGQLVATDFIETITAIEFTPDQAKALFRGRPQEQVKMITVNGDSMDDTICSGDRVFVDVSIHSYDGDGIYVFIFDNNLHIKRLQMHKDRLLVLSDNPKYREWYIDADDHDRFYVMAKVLLGQTVAYKRFS